MSMAVTWRQLRVGPSVMYLTRKASFKDTLFIGMHQGESPPYATLMQTSIIIIPPALQDSYFIIPIVHWPICIFVFSILLDLILFRVSYEDSQHLIQISNRVARCWLQNCTFCAEQKKTATWLILGLRPANERRRYKVTPSLIGRA